MFGLSHHNFPVSKCPTLNNQPQSHLPINQYHTTPPFLQGTFERSLGQDSIASGIYHVVSYTFVWVSAVPTRNQTPSHRLDHPWTLIITVCFGVHIGFHLGYGCFTVFSFSLAWSGSFVGNMWFGDEDRSGNKHSQNESNGVGKNIAEWHRTIKWPHMMAQEQLI